MKTSDSHHVVSPSGEGGGAAGGFHRMLSCLACFYALTVFFYSMNSGLISTNDGSHFALANTMIENKSFKLGDNYRFAVQDSSLYKGEYYSDRHPGLAFFACAFRYAFYPAEHFMMKLAMDKSIGEMTDDGEKARISLFMLIPAAAGSIVCILIFLVLRLMDFDKGLSFLVAAAFAFGTVILRYSTVMYSHMFSACLAMLAFYLAAAYFRKGGNALLLLAFFSLAYAVLAEHIAIFLFVPFSIYVLWKMRGGFFRPAILLPVLVAGLAPALLLAGYNFINFGNPLSLSHFYHSSCSYHHQISTTFDFSRTFRHAVMLLFATYIAEFKFTSLFCSSPFLFITVFFPFLKVVGRKFTAEHFLFISAFVLNFLAVCSFKFPFGGYDLDYRQALYAVPLLAPAVAESLAGLRMFLSGKRAGYYYCILAVFCFSALVAFSEQISHVRVELYQEKYPTPFCNQWPAAWNCSVFMLLVAAYLLLFRLIKWSIVRNYGLRSSHRP